MFDPVEKLKEFIRHQSVSADPKFREGMKGAQEFVSGLLASMMYGMYAQGAWQPKGRNRIDGGAHFYDVYECRDGKFVTIAAAEPQFYADLLQRLGLTEPDILNDRMNPDRWPEFKARFAAVFRTRTRDEWTALLEGTDVCYAPMLDFAEAPRHPHSVARGAFIDVDGVTQPAPAPRFSRTAPEVRCRPPTAGENNHDALLAWGFSEQDIAALTAAGAL